MNISREGIEITRRFFEALDMLKAQSVIRGTRTFTNLYEINRWNMITVKNQPEKSILKPEWLTYLVRDFNVSADWLLTGRGKMLKDKSGKN